MFIHANDLQIKALLTNAQTIAVVGLSPKEQRPSNRVARYLIAAGYQVVPVNPGHDVILGLQCYQDLAAIPHHVDVVDIFRKSQEVPPIVAQAVACGAGAIWMQQGIVHEAAASLAQEAGLECVMDRCIMVDHQRLLADPTR